MVSWLLVITLILKMNSVYSYFISAPTMRVPMVVSDSVNAYLAFRAVLIRLTEFNKNNNDPTTHVICPGLAGSIGRLSVNNCDK